MSEWISVSEGSPEDYQAVIAVDEYTTQVICTFEDGKFVQDTTVAESYGGEPLADLRNFIATHWMPLPEPPQ